MASSCARCSSDRLSLGNSCMSPSAGRGCSACGDGVGAGLFSFCACTGTLSAQPTSTGMTSQRAPSINFEMRLYTIRNLSAPLDAVLHGPRSRQITARGLALIALSLRLLAPGAHLSQQVRQTQSFVIRFKVVRIPCQLRAEPVAASAAIGQTGARRA